MLKVSTAPYMAFNFNYLALTIFLVGLLSFGLGILLAKKGGKAAKWFSYMMGSNGVWAICYAFELANNQLDQILKIINLEYLGIATVPLFWFLFCIHFSDKENLIKSNWSKALLIGMPVITLLMVWTNPWHYLHYKDYSLEKIDNIYLISLQPGFYYHFFTIYFYSFLAFGCFLLYLKMKRADKIFRRQNLSVIIAAIIPWLVNMAYLSGLRPYKYLDLTPFAFSLTSVLIFFSIYRFKLFNIVPIAREKVLELMSDGFLVINQNLILVDFNKAARPYLPEALEDKWVGASVFDLFPNQPLFLQHLKAQIPGKIELICETKAEFKYIEADLIFLNENKIYTDFCLVQIQNLTEHIKEANQIKAQSEELKRLNDLKDSIFSIIAHDLRGPFVNLSEVLKMVANDDISIAEFKALAPSLSKDIIYTTDLLENILHWSRSQLKGFGIKKEYFNLRNLILDEINYHSPSAALKKIKIYHDVFPNAIVYADLIMIQIVIRNLLNNAIKFCEEGGEIQINSHFNGTDAVLVYVSDNGRGMDKTHLNKLFKQQNFTSRGTNNEKGTGLGLMICKEFMEQNNGSIKVKSELGIGSTFILTIPVSEY
ncbi:MAG: PAS domain-containing sensor histidine kinase [Pedobacter sp.]|nr:MAG: PAS domain-containing sensor histidine kinase [Pedobacter sp.]